MNKGSDADLPTFAMHAVARGWVVEATWRDGSVGPTILFADEAEARLWIERDASAWAHRFILAERNIERTKARRHA